MWIDLPEAIHLYARYCRARYGSSATKVVQERATQLSEKGDLDGERIWSDLAREIERIRAAEA